MTCTDMLLSVEGLVVRSNDTTLAGPVSFNLGQGETLGIVGESGSGKTLTAMAIAGLLPQGLSVQGQFHLDGKALSLAGSDISRDFRTSQIGVVFQNPTTALNPCLSIGAQLFEALAPEIRRNKALAATICLQLLQEVGISEPEKKLTAWPHELSGGQAQRVVIAMALARQPKLLIADEPTTALDVTVQAQILDLIVRLQKRHGFGVLLITHDMGVILDRADVVAVMDDGLIVERGPTAELFTKPASSAARTLLKASELTFARVGDTVHAAEPSLVEVTSLQKAFRNGSRALNGVDISVKAGTTLGIVGESGSGKTTLARIIAGLERADGGQVLLDGVALFPRTRSALIQYVFQDPYSSLDPRIAIEETVAEPLRAKGLSKAEALKVARGLLEDVGIHPSLWRRLPGRLSGGQRQRVGFARAIAPGPKLLIADEPVAALDSTSRERVLTLMEDMRRQYGTAQLLISHDLSVVARLCSDVVVMRAGQIIERGSTRQIFENPNHPYTRQLLDAIPGQKQLITPNFSI